MKNIFHNLLEESGKETSPVLGTIVSSKGSAPQVPGASCVFSGGKLIAGTLGGGILEAEAIGKAKNLNPGQSVLYEFKLNASFEDREGAICGGSGLIFLDADPGKHREVFLKADHAIKNNQAGVLLTQIAGPQGSTVERFWYENKLTQDLPPFIMKYQQEIRSCLEERKCKYINLNDSSGLFIQPLYPFPKLIIAGAGHIGKALSHLAGWVGFETTIIDDRPEFANADNLPDADHIIADNIADTLKRTPINPETFIVIVTRGHRQDTEALRVCIGSEAAYIGMIGSRRKVKMMREQFISNGWASALQFDRVHAPIGIDINSSTVHEIAVSICAELIQEKAKLKYRALHKKIEVLILAAGSSTRMGKAKMLLPYGNSTIIEQVVKQALDSAPHGITVVLGKDYEPIQKLLAEHHVRFVINEKHSLGMFSSVKCGVAAIPEGTDAVMILLGDQPMIDSRVLTLMIETSRNSEKGIFVACYGKKRGHPILFKRKYMEEIMNLPPEKSLRDILETYPYDIEEVETGDPGILRDIDTPDDYRNELLKHESK